jgi:hypothetical protein
MRSPSGYDTKPDLAGSHPPLLSSEMEYMAMQMLVQRRGVSFETIDMSI